MASVDVGIATRFTFSANAADMVANVLSCMVANIFFLMTKDMHVAQGTLPKSRRGRYR